MSMMSDILLLILTNQSADLKGFSRHGALPVGLVTEHGPEVSNNVHNPEYEAARTKQDRCYIGLMIRILRFLRKS